MRLPWIELRELSLAGPPFSQRHMLGTGWAISVTSVAYAYLQSRRRRRRMREGQSDLEECLEARWRHCLEGVFSLLCGTPHRACLDMHIYIYMCTCIYTVWMHIQMHPYLGIRRYLSLYRSFKCSPHTVTVALVRLKDAKPPGCFKSQFSKIPSPSLPLIKRRTYFRDIKQC